ncbi:mariner transposase [Plakobranchus ocellatus]|uniref:Mariner transposase n=1 Tax=Plakobranchus ocellatus TaxID=259542 RepID=A0AAV4CC97_9GAST|nr:mariner transposase [Plakobranchus ocellatus]
MWGAGVAAAQQSLAEEFAENVLISRSSVHRILTYKLYKKKIFCKWFPHLLAPDQKKKKPAGSDSQNNSFKDSRERESNRFSDRIITEWGDRNETRSEKAPLKQGSLKVMHIVFFWHIRIFFLFLRWLLPKGTKINAQYFKMFIQDNLRAAVRAVRKKLPGFLQSGVIFHLDNAPVHTTRMVTIVLDEYE